MKQNETGNNEWDEKERWKLNGNETIERKKKSFPSHYLTFGSWLQSIQEERTESKKKRRKRKNCLDKDCPFFILILSEMSASSSQIDLKFKTWIRINVHTICSRDERMSNEKRRRDGEKSRSRKWRRHLFTLEQVISIDDVTSELNSYHFIVMQSKAKWMASAKKVNSKGEEWDDDDHEEANKVEEIRWSWNQWVLNGHSSESLTCCHWRIAGACINTCRPLNGWNVRWTVSLSW